MSDTTKSVDDELRHVLSQLSEDSMWCLPDVSGAPRVDRAKQTVHIDEAAKAITQLFAKQLEEAQIRARIDERAVYINDDDKGRNSIFIARVKNAVEHKHSFNRDSLQCACGVSKMFMVEEAAELAAFAIEATLTQDTKGGTDDTPRV